MKARQEFPPQRGDQRHGRAQHGDGAADHPPRVPQGGLQHLPVDALQPYAGGAFLGQQTIAGQQQRAEYRGLRESDQQGCEDGDAVRQPQRREDAPLGAGQEKHRQENHHGDEGGVDDGSANLHRGAVDHPQVGVGHRPLAVFAQPPEDVLDVDNGVVNHAAEGHRHAAEGHGVDTDTEGAEHDHGQQERKRHGQKADKGRPEAEKEDEQDDGDDARALQQRRPQVFDGGFDERCLAKQRLVQRDTFGQRPFDLVECRLHLVGGRQCVGAKGLGGGTEYQRDAAVEAGIAALRRRPKLHLGHLGDGDRAAAAHGDDGSPQVLQRCHPPAAGDDVFLVRALQHTARQVQVGRLDGLDDLLQGEIVGLEPARRHHHLVLLDAAADADDRGDA